MPLADYLRECGYRVLEAANTDEAILKKPDVAVGVVLAEISPGLAFPICHTSAAADVAGTMLRLAQTRTEVPAAEIKAATPAPAFADSDPPLWGGLGSVTYRTI
jgi:hypothetical protein